jgi:hypothetical protein
MRAREGVAVKLALLAIFASGCMVGGSSSMIGRWKARRVVDSTACVQNQAPGGGCDKRIEIGRDVPARTFKTLTFTFPPVGYVQHRADGEVHHAMAIHTYFDYLVGRGGLAIGARAGAQIITATREGGTYMLPVTLLGHVGGMWGSVYAGVGYSPIAAEKAKQADPMAPVEYTYHHDSVHALIGTRFWLKRTLERGLSFSPELRADRLDGTLLAGVTANFGLHF